MPLFVTTLRAGGPAYTVEPSDPGFLIVRRTGQELAFAKIARLVIDKAGPWYAAFPRSDGMGGYDRVHIIPHE